MIALLHDLLTRAGQALGDTSAPGVLAALLLSLLIVGALVGRFAPSERSHVRTAAFGVLLYAVGTACAALLGDLAPTAVEDVHAVAVLFAHVAGIELGGALLFFVVLPLARLRLPEIVRDLAVGSLYALSVAALLHRFGVEVTSLLASGAVMTLVLGFALQTTLGNVVGGVALRMDGTVSEGDWIRLADRSEGLVRRIRWRHTEVETRDGDTIVVPNSKLVGESIMVLGRRVGGPSLHRMWVYFDVDFRFSPDRVIEVVETALRAAPIPYVADTPAAGCVCTDLARDGSATSAARYAVRFFLTDLRADMPGASAVRARIHAALGRARIPLALPAQTVLVTEVNKKHAERREREEHARRCEVISHIPMFSSLTMDERDSLARELIPAPFARGEIITRQGGTAHWLYVLAEGTADIRVRRDGADERLVADVQAPTIFGEMSLMTGEPRRATVRATSPALCYRLDKQAFQTIINQRPKIAEEMSQFLAHRLVELEAVEEHMDDASKSQRVSLTHGRILQSVQRFFGLEQGPQDASG
jgi:small-conductance mechanosensitive channel/CRP-like cAMP-binding protein